MIFALASIAWGIARLAGGRPGYSRVFTIVARASLFATAGLLVKTILVLATKSPDPPVNLGFWIPGRTPILAGLLALTNPFVIAAAVATARGLADLGLPSSARRSPVPRLGFSGRSRLRKRPPGAASFPSSSR